MKPWLAVAVAVVAVTAAVAAACSKSSAPAPKLLPLDPLPVSIAMPAGATVSQNSPTELMISARECIVLVSPDPGAPLAAPELVPADAGGKHSFTYRASFLGATFKCEPFGPRADVSCEERACKSLRPTAPATAPAGP